MRHFPERNQTHAYKNHKPSQFNPYPQHSRLYRNPGTIKIQSRLYNNPIQSLIKTHSGPIKINPSSIKPDLLLGIEHPALYCLSRCAAEQRALTPTPTSPGSPRWSSSSCWARTIRDDVRVTVGRGFSAGFGLALGCLVLFSKVQSRGQLFPVLD